MLHLFVNLGGVSGLIPMTGVPLLLVSSGGSSTIAALIAIGIAQAIISKFNKEQLEKNRHTIINVSYDILGDLMDNLKEFKAFFFKDNTKY